MKKLFLYFLSLFPLFFLFSSSTFAASDNFTTDYNVTYNVLENGITHATFNISLTNATSQYYASSYDMQVGFANIENVLASDPNGKIKPVVKKNKEGNKIGLTFNKKAVGLDKKLEFTISFDTGNIVQKSGKTWEINIPGLVKQKEYNLYDVTLIVPKFLGNPSYIKPDFGRFSNGAITFTKKELGKSGISISFGNEEIYNFNLIYHLKNPNIFSVKKEIALPPSTNYQDVELLSINPAPLDVVIDPDGNWIAKYNLLASEKLEINVKGKVKVRLRPKKEELSEEKFKEYLKEQPFWETNSQIKNLSQRLKTPYEIYKYVVQTLTYDFTRVESNQPRLGALKVLKNPTSAVCLEFTDLFIALARAAGIPAREINGFAYTQNSKERPASLIKDVLHAWPEYYDSSQKTWIMIDPTWENTTFGIDYFHTLDFNHIAFVIKGLNSNFPVSAGGYKISNKKTKDVSVEFGDTFDQPVQKLSFSADFLKDYSSLFNLKGNIIIKNTGTALSSPQSIYITTESLKPVVQKIDFGNIPPFGILKIPVSFEKPPLLTNKKDRIKIAINSDYIFSEINISPFILNKWIVLGGIVFVGIIIAISVIAKKSGSLSFSKRKR